MPWALLCALGTAKECKAVCLWAPWPQKPAFGVSVLCSFTASWLSGCLLVPCSSLLICCAQKRANQTKIGMNKFRRNSENFPFFFVCPLGPHPRHMEVPRLGRISTVATGLYHNHSDTRSELRLRPTHGSGQCRILNPLRKARDQTCNLMVPNRIRFLCATTGAPILSLFSYDVR